MNELMKQAKKVDAILGDIVKNPNTLPKDDLNEVIQAVEELSQNMSEKLAEVKKRRKKIVKSKNNLSSLT